MTGVRETQSSVVRCYLQPYRTECLALISIIPDDVGRAFMFTITTFRSRTHCRRRPVELKQMSGQRRSARAHDASLIVGQIGTHDVARYLAVGCPVRSKSEVLFQCLLGRTIKGSVPAS